MIRNLDGSNTANNSQSRKAGLGDSDDEELSSQSTAGERSTMNIYRLRQQKRVKLATNTNSSDHNTPPVLT